MRSILTGARYPENLLTAVLSRIRADGHTNYNRASLTKAILIKNHKKEVQMQLDKDSPYLSYQLGRLFAVLEKTQEDAIPGANTTIKDKFFGSASSTPGSVFPTLFSNYKNHLKKVRSENKGRAIWLEKLVGEIMEYVPPEHITAHMPLPDQGLFFIGYYHQRNDFFKSECEKCKYRFSSWEAIDKPDEKASKKDYRVVACPKCGASVEVKKHKKSEKTEKTEE
jgi:CRISPR-associated protein Csd1